MKRFKNILYILDDVSLRQTGNAVKVAELARLNEAQVTILISQEVEFLDDLSRRLTGRYDEIRQAIVADQRERLDNVINQHHWQGLAVQPDYSQSADFISIIRKVMNRNYDLVIRDAALEQGIDQLSMRLVRKCPCPVWVLKYNSTGFKHILAAVDVGEKSPEAVTLNKKIVELTHSLAQREGGEAHYLHSWRLEYEAMLNSPRFKISTAEIDEMKKALFTERQKGMLSLLDGNHILFEERQIHIDEGVSSEVIQQAIEQFSIDVVVMGSVGRSGIPGLLIGNKAEQLLSSINCSVLTVKPDGFKTPITQT